MITELEDRIRERAHRIWESEGRPGDRAEAHWSMASAEIAAGDRARRRPAPRREGRCGRRAQVEKTEKAPRAKAAAKPRASKA